MKPNTAKEAVAWALAHVGKPAPGGKGHCQELVRTAYGLPAWADSAKKAYALTPKNALHTDSSPKAIQNIPPGGIVYYPTLSNYGHVVISIGGGFVVSNDYPDKWGEIVKAPIALPAWHGLSHFGGWSWWTPYGTIQP
jgi:hypothetical protein